MFAERETATPIRHVRVRVCPACWDRGWRLRVAHESDPLWNLDAAVSVRESS